ncbi:MAG: taurine dioxygenase [Pseudomonadota bacterium]
MKKIEIQPLSPAIGAMINHVDLLDASQFEELKEPLMNALHEHHVLFFENQPLSPEQLRDLAAVFGDLHIHPIYPTAEGVPEIIVLDTNDNNPPDSDTWHTDVTFIQTPPMGSILSARLLPPTGGDTLWASCIAAYEALSESFQRFLDPLTAEHDLLKAFTAERYGKTPEEYKKWEEARNKNKTVVHPVIRTHPVSGRKGIFVNESFTTRIIELSPKEGAAILSYLFELIAKPEFTVRWKWKQFDLAFWDNRLTQHYACANYLPHRRIMHRATILGDVPFH